jgi:hypothetical protein
MERGLLLIRHARPRAGHPRLTLLQTKTAANKDVDGRDKPGHDARGAFANLYLRIFASAGSMSLD